MKYLFTKEAGYSDVPVIEHLTSGEGGVNHVGIHTTGHRGDGYDSVLHLNLQNKDGRSIIEPDSRFVIILIHGIEDRFSDECYPIRLSDFDDTELDHFSEQFGIPLKELSDLRLMERKHCIYGRKHVAESEVSEAA
jgi:hypothetical protein